MSKELIQKTIRCLIAGLCFVCLLSIVGVMEREAQQFGMMLGIILIFSFVLRNLWITLFLVWTVFLYCFFKFQVGEIYLSNIFYGCVLFYLTKLAFAKKHIDFFINALLWLVFINIAYMSLQMWQYDFIYKAFRTDDVIMLNITPVGFMGNTGYLGCLMAFAVPLLATRGSKWATVGALGLFVPLFLVDSTLCIAVAAIGLLYVLFFKMYKNFKYWKLVWVLILIILILGTVFYAKEIDGQGPGIYIRLEHWKYVMRYAVQHPVVGWGMDSYRNVTKNKGFRFSYGSQNYWDNPHNLYISLVFEFGGVGLFLFGGYLRRCMIRFNHSIKDKNTIALGGFLLMFLLLSIGHFPMFLARCAVFIIPAIALLEVQTDG